MINDINSKPQVLPVIKDNIPEDLKNREQWVVWKLVWNSKDRKYTKVPKNPTSGRNAKSNDPKTWTDYDTALMAYEKGGYDGIGFETTPDDPFLFWDLDHSFDPNIRHIESGFDDIVIGLESYTEISPSGTGLRIVVKAKKPIKKCRAGWIEVYDNSRYLTITGQLYSKGSLLKIEERQGQVNRLLSEIFEENKKEIVRHNSPQTPIALPDDQIIEKAFKSKSGEKIRRLYQGDIAEYGGDHSAADQGLCCHLAFWFNRDPEKIDRAFRLSGLMRPKWDEVHSGGGLTYGQMTINTALQFVNNGYDPAHYLPATINHSSKKYLLTDTGNGERFADQHSHQVRFCHPWKKWIIWYGSRWKNDSTGKIKLLAKETVRSMYSEASKILDNSQCKELAKWAIQSEAEYRKDKMLSSAQSEPGIPVEPNDLDKNPWLLNVENGTINLKTGQLLQHNPSDLITKLCSVKYDPAAQAPIWDKFLNTIFDGNQDLIYFIQQAVGYSLTGDTSEQCLFFCFGSGANGKTTFLETISALLGDYSTHADFSTFLSNTNSSIRNDLARLKGARFVCAAEVSADKQFDEVIVKQVTGGDLITARFLYQESFEYRPEYKIFLAANHTPAIIGEDHAIWRRIHLLPFEVRIPEKKQDKGLIKKLKTELPGILNWALEGCLDWKSNGLIIPSEVKEATSSYRNEMDVVSKFINDRCVVNPPAKVERKKLYHQVYIGWCKNEGIPPSGKIKFNKKIAERGFKHKYVRIHGGKQSVWVGIGLKSDIYLGEIERR
jgi:putative DNA primase/helicase